MGKAASEREQQRYMQLHRGKPGWIEKQLREMSFFDPEPATRGSVNGPSGSPVLHNSQRATSPRKLAPARSGRDASEDARILTTMVGTKSVRYSLAVS